MTPSTRLFRTGTRVIVRDNEMNRIAAGFRPFIGQTGKVVNNPLADAGFIQVELDNDNGWPIGTYLPERFLILSAGPINIDDDEGGIV